MYRHDDEDARFLVSIGCMLFVIALFVICVVYGGH